MYILLQFLMLDSVEISVKNAPLMHVWTEFFKRNPVNEIWQTCPLFQPKENKAQKQKEQHWLWFKAVKMSAGKLESIKKKVVFQTSERISVDPELASGSLKGAKLYKCTAGESDSFSGPLYPET